MLASYARIIRSPRYFPIWVGQLVSNLGDTVNYIALVVQMYRLTGSGIALSTLVIIQLVPVIVAGPIAGPLIDRVPRKRVLILADLTRAVLALGLVAASQAWELYLLAVCLSLAGVFFTPTLSASLPGLVDGEDLLAANAVAWSTAQLVQILGSAVTGGLIAAVGIRAAFAFNAGSYLVSATSIAHVAFPAVHAGTDHTAGSYLQALRDGLSYARTDRFVSRMVVVQLLASLAVGGTSALLVVLATRHYHLPAAGLATFLLAIGAGALLGPLILGSITRTYRDHRLLFLPYIVRGVGDVLLGLATIPFIGELLLFVYGLNTSSGMVTYQSVIQARIPDRMRGRVFTLMDVVWNSARLVSIALAGLVADHLGIAAVYYLGGSLLVVAGLVGLLLVRLDDEPARPNASRTAE